MAYELGGIAVSYGLYRGIKSQVRSLQVLWRSKAMVVR
jgi:hypothetical protein